MGSSAAPPASVTPLEAAFNEHAALYPSQHEWFAFVADTPGAFL